MSALFPYTTLFRSRRDRTHAGQSGKLALGTHPAVMGPCGEADGSGHGSDAVLLEQWRGLAGVDAFSPPCAVGGDLFVEPDHVPAQSNSLRPGRRRAEI